MLCEECGEKEAEKDVLLDGNSVSMCSRCASISSGVVVDKPTQDQVDDSKRMWRVKEILARSAGIPYTEKPVNLPNTLRTVSLEDLRRVDRDKKSAYQVRAESRMKRYSEESEKKNSADNIIEEAKTFKEEVD